MKVKPWVRIALLLCAGLIGLTYKYPLWTFELWAPQYPEGLAMQVWTSKLTGSVRNINILNHYVGMKPIEEEGFPELKIFPVALGLFMATALVTAVMGKRKLVLIWSGIFLLFCAGSLADFYIWEYNFGHDLSEDAAIKMEGETYQPPFIGSKTLLSITAKSFPAFGGYALAGAGGIAALVFFSIIACRGRNRIVALSLASVMLIGCQADQVSPISFGEDHCHECKMVITDPRFGGEVVMSSGKHYKFDSLDCLFRFNRDNKEPVGKILVVDSFNLGELQPVERMSFVKSERLRSPMGIGVLASMNKEELRASGDGEIQSWNQIKTLYPN